MQKESDNRVNDPSADTNGVSEGSNGHLHNGEEETSVPSSSSSQQIIDGAVQGHRQQRGGDQAICSKGLELDFGQQRQAGHGRENKNPLSNNNRGSFTPETNEKNGQSMYRVSQPSPNSPLNASPNQRVRVSPSFYCTLRHSGSTPHLFSSASDQSSPQATTSRRKLLASTSSLVSRFVPSQLQPSGIHISNPPHQSSRPQQQPSHQEQLRQHKNSAAAVVNTRGGRRVIAAQGSRHHRGASEENSHRVNADDSIELNQKYCFASPSSIDPLRAWYDVEAVGSHPPPCQRSLHSSALMKNHIYIFGGYDGTSRVNDFYSFDCNSRSWSTVVHLGGQPPSPRDRHISVVYEDIFYVFGGFDGRSRVNDLHGYDTASRMWAPILAVAGSPPSARHSHAAVVHHDSMYIFGGYDGSYRSDLNEFNFLTSTWSTVVTSGRSPRARYRATCVMWNSIMIVFGGHDGTRHLADTHVLALETRCWAALPIMQGTPPLPRDSHVSVVHGNSMYVFGGSTGSAMNDLHQLKMQIQSANDHRITGVYDRTKDADRVDQLTASWAPIVFPSAPPPSPATKREQNGSTSTPQHRFCHVGVCYDHAFYVFGGYDGTNRLNDFISFDFGLQDQCGAILSDLEPSTLVKDLTSFVNNPELSDVKFLVEGETVYAHKFMLIRSSYFRAMFLGEMKESTQDCIPLEHIELQVFLLLLEFLYTDQVHIPLEYAMEAFAAADAFCVPRLKSLCERNIFSSISVDTAASIFLAADLYNANTLKERTLHYILMHFEMVSKSQTFEEMARTNVELVFEILRKR